MTIDFTPNRDAQLQNHPSASVNTRLLVADDNNVAYLHCTANMHLPSILARTLSQSGVHSLDLKTFVRSLPSYPHFSYTHQEFPS